jgi:ADP-ribose pyrophosphatase YjhB (NUDIX family)
MNSYIKTMRDMIGKKPLLICGASTIVVRDGQVLLQKRTDNGCWGYHGGCLELGEQPEEGARRELFEETGLIPEAMELFNVYSGPDRHFTYPNGDEVYVVDVVYVCRKFKGVLAADKDEVSELRWFPAGAIPENLSPPVKGILHDFVRQELENERKG